MPEREPQETDWLANSVYGYGYGYTKGQALRAMLAETNPSYDRDLEVVLIEHVGTATTSMMKASVEEFVSGERIEIPADQIEELHQAAAEAKALSDLALDQADRLEDLERAEA